MSEITADSFTLSGLTKVDIDALYESLQAYVYRDGTAGLEGEELAKFKAAYELFNKITSVREPM